MSSNHIEFHDYVTDLAIYYSNATVLIDINAYFDNDVFLSSKIINYLSIYKPIISLTGHNSPSRNVFTEDDSIIHSLHNVDDIYDAMLTAINTNVVLERRNRYIKLFSKEYIVRNFIDEISTL